MFGAYSDKGAYRARQEDEFVVAHGRTAKSPSLLAVFDGMGGTPRGDLGAQIAAKALAEKHGQISSAKTRAERKALLSDAFHQIHRTIVSEMTRLKTGGGTTGTAISLKNLVPVIAHAGDSRAYLATHAGIFQLTTDHAIAGTNMLTKSLGGNAGDDHETYHFGKIPPGAALLLCSDGVHKTVGDSSLKELLSQGKGASRIAKEIVQAALRAGSKDNATAVVFLNRRVRKARKKKQ